MGLRVVGFPETGDDRIGDEAFPVDAFGLFEQSHECDHERQLMFFPHHASAAFLSSISTALRISSQSFTRIMPFASAS